MERQCSIWMSRTVIINEDTCQVLEVLLDGGDEGVDHGHAHVGPHLLLQQVQQLLPVPPAQALQSAHPALPVCLAITAVHSLPKDVLACVVHTEVCMPPTGCEVLKPLRWRQLVVRHACSMVAQPVSKQV